VSGKTTTTEITVIHARALYLSLALFSLEQQPQGDWFIYQ